MGPPLFSSTVAFFIITSLYLLCSSVSTEQQQQQRRHRRSGGELFEVRVFEGAPPGTKATLNEAFDRALREQSSCFAQLESDVDWLDFDPVRLIFETVAELPANNTRPAQFAVLHLLCPQHKQVSLHFSVHITRRNRHPPRFSSPDYRFFAPTNLPTGAEIGRVHVEDQDPIIYNSQVQLSIVHSGNGGAPGKIPSADPQISPKISSALSSGPEDLHWEIARNGSLLVRRSLGELRLFRPYQIRLLAVDFGSPQLFSLANVTIVPVSVSQPRNMRVNVAHWRYQIFEWDLPTFGVPERFRLTLRRKGDPRALHEQEMEPTESIAMSRVRLPLGTTLEATVAAVDVDGETPSEEVAFQVVENDLHCDDGQCAAGAGVPMCHYSHAHQMRQYRDSLGQLHCLCFAGFSGAQCDQTENCPSQRAFEPYGGVDWPRTAVNQTASVPCPYNEDGKRMERRCGWAEEGEEPKWENATEVRRGGERGTETRAGTESGREAAPEERCKTQSSVLVHLGVLANYAQRAEQTLSGLQSVQRFLDSLLLFPAFDPSVPSAHFDAKIAEHVAQVLDSLASRNLSSLAGGNATELSEHLLDYIWEFAGRMPVPFSLQSASGGLQLRAWDILPFATDGDSTSLRQQYHSIQLGPCFAQPPPRAISGQGRAVSRAACIRNSTLLPMLEGRSPLLMLETREEEGMKNGSAGGEIRKIGQERWTWGREGLVIGFRVAGEKQTWRKSWEETEEDEEEGRERGNLTCAFFDKNIHAWSTAGVSLISRDHRPHGQQQVVLCEFRSSASMSSSPGLFALLPESLFRPPSVLAFWLGIVAPLATLLLSLGILLGLFFICAFFHSRSSSSSDPVLLVLLLSLLLLHLFHLVLLLLPLRPPSSSSFSSPWPPSSTALFSCLQLALLSLAASLALLNASLHSRIVRLEMEQYQQHHHSPMKGPSRGGRLLSTLTFAIVLPCALCVLCALLDGQILAGLDSAEPRLLPFNWAFGLTLLAPLVLFLGSAMGFGAYSFWYGNSLASSASSPSGDDLPPSAPSFSSAFPLRRRLLHQLSSACGLSLLVLLFSFGNLLVLLQPPDLTRSLFLTILYLCTTLTISVLLRLLARIQRRLPHCRHIAVASNGLRPNTLVDGIDEGTRPSMVNGKRRKSQEKENKYPVVLLQSGECQAIGPNGMTAMGDPNNNGNSPGSAGGGADIPNGVMDRQFLLRRSVLSTSGGAGPANHRPPFATLPAPSSSAQQRLSGTVSTSAGTVLLESEDLASLDRAIIVQGPNNSLNSSRGGEGVQMNQSQRMDPNLFAEAEDDEEEEEEDLDAFLENGTDTLRALGRAPRQGNRNDGTENPAAPPGHPLVSVV